MTNGIPTQADYEAMDAAMLAFYQARVAAGSADPKGDTEEEFGERADWCVIEDALGPKVVTHGQP